MRSPLWGWSKSMHSTPLYLGGPSHLSEVAILGDLLTPRCGSRWWLGGYLLHFFLDGCPCKKLDDGAVWNPTRNARTQNFIGIYYYFFYCFFGGGRRRRSSGASNVFLVCLEAMSTFWLTIWDIQSLSCLNVHGGGAWWRCMVAWSIVGFSCVWNPVTAMKDLNQKSLKQ